jgi:hypothetical protein
MENILAGYGTNSDEVKAKADELNTHATDVLAAKVKFGHATADLDRLPTVDEYNKMQDQLVRYDDWLSRNRADYDEAVAAAEKAHGIKNMVSAVTLRAGGTIMNPRLAESALAFVGSFYGYETDDQSPVSSAQELEERYGDSFSESDRTTVNERIGDIDNQIGNIQFVTDLYGDRLPEPASNGLQNGLDELYRQKRLTAARLLLHRQAQQSQSGTSPLPNSGHVQRL